MKVLPTQPTPFSNSRLGESQFHFLITRTDDSYDYRPDWTPLSPVTN